MRAAMRSKSQQNMRAAKPSKRGQQDDDGDSMRLESFPGMRQQVQPEPRKDTRPKEPPSSQMFVAAAKLSVVASLGHEQHTPDEPVGERAVKAAQFIFRACNATQSGTLQRWEFASVVEMMMRQKLVSYLIEQVDAARLDAEFEEAAQGADECGFETFARWHEKFDA